MPSLEENTHIRHSRFGIGSIITDRGTSVVVRFEHGIEECLPADLELLHGFGDRATTESLDPAVNVVTRILANCIISANDAWGVFSSSRIALLPHQLWVCKRVLESWPTRWLVADDVGLGKTIEAGLIISPLLASGRVRRLLIIAPASLVGQWQMRLREMFDIRILPYASANDTPTSDYWNTQDKVIASAHTIRKDTGERWSRLLDADPWDLVMVDEAHHMNVDEQEGQTLSFQLIEQMQKRRRIHSLVLFTGTPHRGKDYGFLSLLKLLRPTDFDPRAPLEEQIGKLKTVMIRNNKQRATDMQGNPIFTPVRSHTETYAYSRDETRFYNQITHFITTGKAYAAGLGQQQRRLAILVLKTMQKLASSSIAAVRRALTRRLTRLRNEQERREAEAADRQRLEELMGEDDPASLDEISAIEERLVDSLGGEISLNPNEIPALEELLESANKVRIETKIEHILDVLDRDFSGRSVLFFTEYKATQALLMSALHAKYGNDCVAFINGDGFIEDVSDAGGVETKLTETRQYASSRFNRGTVRFLVSTEAAGEGVDLQNSCSTLVHVDLPWNPMRLHQRVGRLSRYGQTDPVDVMTVRNPDTIESEIWDCLDSKLDRITLAFQGVMEDPEDMRQLVLGMASPRMYTRVFADIDPNLRGPRLKDWFDSETATLGGEEAVNVVRDLFGNVARFDFGQVADQIPRADLPDLIPFFKSLFATMGRRPDQVDVVRLAFRTPRQWLDEDFTIAERYQLLFSRELRPGDGEDVAGVGLRVVDRALRMAIDSHNSAAVMGNLPGPLVVFTIQDRITGTDGTIRRIVVGLLRREGTSWELLRDWEVLRLLNPVADRPRSAAFDSEPVEEFDIPTIVATAERTLRLRLDELDLPFQLPDIEQLSCLVPGAKTAG